MKRKITVLGLILALLICMVVAQEKESTKVSNKDKAEGASAAAHKSYSPSDLQWGPAPPGLPPGGQIVVLDGDPKQKGSFTMRLKTPAGYRIMPHTHPSAEHVTVISGAVRLGMGEKFDETTAQELTAGSFVVMPAGMKHFASMASETIVQIHGEGPFEIKYVNPADDPRNAKKVP